MHHLALAVVDLHCVDMFRFPEIRDGCVFFRFRDVGWWRLLVHKKAFGSTYIPKVNFRAFFFIIIL